MSIPNKLHALLDADAATQQMQEHGMPIVHAVPTYVRHKPGETTIVTYRFDLADGTTSWGYVHWCETIRRADEIFDKAVTLRPRSSALGSGLERLDPQTVLYCLPNDARLRRMRWYVDPRKLKRSLASILEAGDRIKRNRTSVEVLRYKPERRIVNHIRLATANHEPRSLLLRYSTKAHGEGLHLAANHLRSHNVNTPAPLAILERGRVSIDEFIPGEQLLDCIENNSADSGAFAAELARFHNTPPVASQHRGAAVELAGAQSGLQGLATLRPELAKASNEVCMLLEQTLPKECSAAVLIHGDLHTKNVLVDNTSISFVDLERVATGSAAVDLGCLLGHAIAHPIRGRTTTTNSLAFAHEVVDHYQTLNGPLPRTELWWHTAIGLVDQALLVARHLETNWKQKCQQLLTAATNQLATRSLR